MVGFMQRFNVVSGCRKMVSVLRLNVTRIESPTYLSTLTSAQKNHNFNIPLILDKYNIMIVMQKN